MDFNACHGIRPVPNKRRMIVCILSGALLLAHAPTGLAQSTEEIEALRSEIQALKAGQAAMQRDLAAIKDILERATRGRSERPFEPQDVAIANSPSLGMADAPVTLVEFTDYQCPFCKQHSLQTKPRLVKDYVEAGKLKYVLREFPIAQIHPQAPKAAQAALCAKEQGQYWAMAEVFFRNQGKLGVDHLKGYAADLGLDAASFEACLDSDRYARQVQADLEDGVRLGVRGTPTFFLGVSDPEDPTKVRVTKALRGAQSYPLFQQAIDELLAEVAKGS